MKYWKKVMQRMLWVQIYQSQKFEWIQLSCSQGKYGLCFRTFSFMTDRLSIFTFLSKITRVLRYFPCSSWRYQVEACSYIKTVWPQSLKIIENLYLQFPFGFKRSEILKLRRAKLYSSIRVSLPILCKMTAINFQVILLYMCPFSI